MLSKDLQLMCPYESSKLEFIYAAYLHASSCTKTVECKFKFIYKQMRHMLSSSYHEKHTVILRTFEKRLYTMLKTYLYEVPRIYFGRMGHILRISAQKILTHT